MADKPRPTLRRNEMKKKKQTAWILIGDDRPWSVEFNKECAILEMHAMIEVGYDRITLQRTDDFKFPLKVKK